jgi:hypothetical protein
MSNIDWEAFRKEAERSMKTARLPPTWRPEREGDMLMGVIVDIRPNPWDKTINTLIIRTPDGKEFMTPRNQTLVSLIDYWKPEIGDLIAIRYDGLGVKKPGKNPPKIFSMYVKRVQERIPAPRPPAEEEVEEMEAAIETPETEEETEEIIRAAREAMKPAPAPQPEIDVEEVEVAKEYVLNEVLPAMGGLIHEKKLDKLLQQKGFKVTTRNIVSTFGGELIMDKYGYVKAAGGARK